jgi:hypothetical protein
MNGRGWSRGCSSKTLPSRGDPKSENMRICGDNLLALKALEQDFAGFA